MKRLFLILLCGVALLAQDSVSRVLQLKNIHPNSAMAVLNVLAGKQVRWQADNNLKVIVMNGPPELVNALVEAIQKLDVPPPAARTVELTFHMLLAAPQGEAPPIPQELGGVATQLRNVFGVKSVRLLETAVLRGREGSTGEMRGALTFPMKLPAPAAFELRYSGTRIIAGDKVQNIRIDSLHFTAKVPHPVGTGFQYFDAALSTDLDVREGQKVVVGKSSIDAASQSLFLVVTAKVVD